MISEVGIYCTKSLDKKNLKENVPKGGFADGTPKMKDERRRKSTKSLVNVESTKLELAEECDSKDKFENAYTAYVGANAEHILETKLMERLREKMQNLSFGDDIVDDELATNANSDLACHF